MQKRRVWATLFVLNLIEALSKSITSYISVLQSAMTSADFSFLRRISVYLPAHFYSLTIQISLPEQENLFLLRMQYNIV